jgi:hypothetical protein
MIWWGYMERLKPERIDLSSINNGLKYKKGDGVQATAINSAIQSSAYAQEIAEHALDLMKDTQAGTVTLSAYPIGSVYISTNSISPASLFGGDWELITSNGFLPLELPKIVSNGDFELKGGYGENIGFITPDTIISKDGGVGTAYFVNNNTVTGTATNSKLSYYKGLELQSNGISGIYAWKRVG